MPKLSGTSHIDFTVTDLERSIDFYQKTLGVRQLIRGRNEAENFEFGYFQEPQTGLILGLVKHDGTAPGAFDPKVTGLDHVSFAVDDPAELHKWATHLESVGVAHNGYSDQSPIGAGLNFYDPDGIALEFYWISPQAVPAK